MELLSQKLSPNLKIEKEKVIENCYIALKKIGIKQNNQYTSILLLANNKIKLPEWIDEIQKVLYIGNVTDKESIENNMNNYIVNASPMTMSTNFMTERNTIDYKYFIRDGYIHSSIKEGYIIVVHTSVPITSEGDILIQEEINLIEALVWYNVTEYLWTAMVRSPQQYAGLYQIANEKWSYYAINAKTASIFPKNEDELKGFRNKFMKILPNLYI